MKAGLLNVVFALAFASLMSGFAKAQACPRAVNVVRYCYGQNCWGQTQVGSCQAPMTSSADCNIYTTPCCGKQYPFAVAQGTCGFGLVAACLKPSEKVIARRLLVSSKVGGDTQTAMIMPVRPTNEPLNAPFAHGQSSPDSKFGVN